MNYSGELAALATAVSFAFTSTFFTLAGKVVGSEVVNRSRLVFALLLLLFTHLILYGSIFPGDVPLDRLTWLSLSGIIGFAFGDAFLFQSFLMIGPRLSMLIMSMAPILASIFARLFLGEILTPMQTTGIIVAILGIFWVIASRPHTINSINPAEDDQNTRLGLLFAFLGALGQAGGQLLSKLGVYGDFSPITGNIIRMVGAIIVVWGITFFQRKAASTITALFTHKKQFLLILCGAISGPFLGVSASLFALQNAPVGVVSTLIASTPIFMLPISWFIFNDRFDWRTVLGTFIGLIGITILILG